MTPIAALLALSLLAAADRDGFARIPPPAIAWRDVPGGHGSQTAGLLGDPAKPGIYVIRMRFAPHWMDTPHWHPNDRYVTVISGTWCTGTGRMFDPGAIVRLPPGSLMKHPGGGVHWDGSCADEPVEVQIIGEGPAATTQADPSGPGWVRVD